MQNAKQATKVKILNNSIWAFVIMLLLASCTKSALEAPGQNKIQDNASAKPSTDKVNNSMIAVPFEDTLLVPCANGGAGERVVITGSTHFVYQLVWNDQGFHLVYHENSKTVNGVGLTTGDTFSGNDGIQGTVTASWVNSQWVATTNERMSLVGKGANYSVISKHHIVITPDGKVSVSIDDKSIECK